MSNSFENSRTINNSPELSLSNHKKEILDYIEGNKQPVDEALSGLIKDNRFVLVGESHLQECEPIRREVVFVLGRLQQEGLTHLALEANSMNQEVIDNLDFSDPNIIEILKEKRIAGVVWGEGNFDILIQAKKLGLKVVLIDFDDGRTDSQRDNAQWQNLRDGKMFQALSGQVSEGARVLIFIGSDHVHKKPVWDVHGYSYERAGANRGEKINRLGARLSDKYGAEQVAAVRHVGSSGRFDGLFLDNYYFYRHQSRDPFFDRPKSMKAILPEGIKPKNISNNNQELEVVIIPDKGPVRGDSRVSATDFIVTII